MNLLLTTFSLHPAGGGLAGLLVSFLIILVVIAIIWGLLWAIENWISPIPPPVKMILAIIILALVVIWAINAVGGA